MGIADRLALGRQQHARFLQRIHDQLVGIAPPSILVNDAATFKTIGILGVEPIGVDRRRNGSTILFSPDIVVVGTMAGSGVDKARTCVVGDMITIEKWNRKVIALLIQRDDRKLRHRDLHLLKRW